jgi:hypothetical protein
MLPPIAVSLSHGDSDALGDRAVLDPSWVYAELAPHYSHLGRPSIDPVLIAMYLPFAWSDFYAVRCK